MSGLDINGSVQWTDLNGTDGVQPVGTTRGRDARLDHAADLSAEPAPAEAAAAAAAPAKAPAKAARK